MKKSVKFLFVSAIALGSFNAKAQTWSWTGNPGTNPPTNFVGTTDLKDLYLKTNGTSAMTILSSNQNVGIGITNPAKKLHVSGATQFDVVATGVGNGRFYFNRPSITNYENLISFTTAGTSTYDWTFGTSNGSPDFILSGWTALRSLTILQASGNVGIGNTPNPVTKLHVNGDVTLGSTTNKRKWRFITQNWLDYGKMFLTPDDASGNPDYTKAMTIDPSKGNFIFGTEIGNSNVSLGSAKATGLTVTNIYSTGSYTYNGNTYVGFNAWHDGANGSWQNYNDGTNNGSSIIWSTIGGDLNFSVMPSTGATSNGFNEATVKNGKVMQVRWNTATGFGQVVIGHTTIVNGAHTDFRLSVDGKVLAQELYVTTQNWADYVFDKNYKLKTLKELEEFINTNKHLPNVPSASEIATIGNNVGDNEKIMLEKIEELTLYVIQQNKKIEELEKQVSTIQKK